MRKAIFLNVTISHEAILDESDRAEIAGKFRTAVDMITTQLAGGAERVPVSFVVGQAEAIEPYCRTCKRTETELRRIGIQLEVFDSTRGLRPSMEAMPEDGPVSHYCGCIEAALQRKSILDDAARDSRNVISAPYLPVPQAASVDALADLENKLRAEIARLNGSQ
jgi:hypothetical protein